MDLEIRKNEIYDKMVLSTEGSDALKESVLSAMEQYAEDYQFERVAKEFHQTPYQNIEWMVPGSTAKEVALDASVRAMPSFGAGYVSDVGDLLTVAQEIYDWLTTLEKDKP